MGKPFSASVNSVKLSEQQQSLVLSCIRYAQKQANWYADMMKVHRPWLVKAEVAEDLTSAAFHGLCIAAQRYDPERGTKFLTYASQYVRASLQGQARHWDPLSPSFTFHHGLGRRGMEQSSGVIIRIGETKAGEEARSDTGPPARHDEQAFSLDEFEELIRPFARKWQSIAKKRFVDDLSYEEIGRIYGVSKERVRQILNIMYAKIRAANPHLEEA